MYCKWKKKEEKEGKKEKQQDQQKTTDNDCVKQANKSRTEKRK